MVLAVRREPFDHPDWLYELKYDEFRALALIEAGFCQLVSRKAHVYNSFPGLSASLAQLQHEAVLDGEIVCLDSDGRPQFDRLFYRRDQPYFYAFDLLYLNGRDLRALPLMERKQILLRIAPHQDSRLLYVRQLTARVLIYSGKCAPAILKASSRS